MNIIHRMMARWIRLGAIEPFDFRAGIIRRLPQRSRRSPAHPLVGQGDGQYLFALIAPKRIRARARDALGLFGGLRPPSPLTASSACRYLDGESICLHGQKVATATIAPIGECAVIASSFLNRSPAKCVPHSIGRDGGGVPPALEAQHGWQFDPLLAQRSTRRRSIAVAMKCRRAATG